MVRFGNFPGNNQCRDQKEEDNKAGGPSGPRYGAGREKDAAVGAVNVGWSRGGLKDGNMPEKR